MDHEPLLVGDELALFNLLVDVDDLPEQNGRLGPADLAQYLMHELVVVQNSLRVLLLYQQSEILVVLNFDLLGYLGDEGLDPGQLRYCYHDLLEPCEPVVALIFRAAACRVQGFQTGHPYLHLDYCVVVFLVGEGAGLA